MKARMPWNLWGDLTHRVQDEWPAEVRIFGLGGFARASNVSRRVGGSGIGGVAIPRRIGSLHGWGVIGGNANIWARHFSRPPGWGMDKGATCGNFIASQRWLL